MNILRIYAAGWLGLVFLAILNGTAREKIYAPRMSERTAHQVSTAIGMVLFGVYIWGFSALFPINTTRQALSIGAMWLIMTVAFEFGFGRYVIGHSWATLCHDYDLSRGRIWLLVLIWIAVAPTVFFRLQSRPMLEALPRVLNLR